MRICTTCNHPLPPNSASWHCTACNTTPCSQDGIIRFLHTSAESGAGYNTQTFSATFELEARHFWFRAKRRLLLWAMSKWGRGRGEYLEIGCGGGYFLKAFAEHFPTLAVQGTDLFLEGLQFARQRLPILPLYQMDATAIPFREEFSTIGIYDVLEHIPQDQAAMNEIAAALKPGGILLLTVPQHPRMWSWVDEMLCHVRRYRRTDLVKVLRGSGLQPIKVTSFVSLLFAAMVAERIKCKLLPPAHKDPAADLRINPLLNHIFGLVMRVELLLIRLGVNFPFGGSLFVVARKEPLPPAVNS